MAERDRADNQSSSAQRAPRKRYTTPRLEEYGHVAKLTQSGGTTKTEAGNPAMMACL